MSKLLKTTVLLTALLAITGCGGGGGGSITPTVPQYSAPSANFSDRKSVV